MPKTFPDHGPVQENAHENAERGFDTKADFIAGHPRNRKKPVTYKASLPPMKIGFQSIASNMNQWIREAEKDLLKK